VLPIEKISFSAAFSSNIFHNNCIDNKNSIKILFSIQTNDSNTIKYCDDQFMELRDKMDRKNFDEKVDDVIEIDDED
jgi:hypothetical protein